MENNLFCFAISVFVLQTGKYSLTMRCREPKSPKNEYVWAGKYNENISLIALPLQLRINIDFKPERVKRFVCWFNSCLNYIKCHRSNSVNFEGDLIRSFASSFFGLYALERNINIYKADAIVQLLLRSKFISTSASAKRVLLYFIGSSYIATSLLNEYI